MRVTSKLRQSGLVRALWSVAGYRSPISSFRKYREAIKDKHGLEIGGPSSIFRSRRLLPIYPLAFSVDQVNFSDSTIWGNGKPSEKQYIMDGVDLSEIPSSTYDFVLSSHSLEHIANPLKALSEWSRVLKSEGFIVLVLPDPRFTFDHKRPLTTFKHLLDDLCREAGEDDLTHLPEILSLHDLSRDPGAGSRENFEGRSRNNFQYRALHHHVFSDELMSEMVGFVGLKTISADTARPFHMICLAQKIEA
jgi:SAM-dependent methyltransferase